MIPSRCVKFCGLQISAQFNEVVPERVDDFGAIYEDNYRLLVSTAIERFHITRLDAQGLAHEVFLAYFLKADEILNSRAWLMAAICNASKHYLRSRARLVSYGEEFGKALDPKTDGDTLPDQLVVREAFSCVTAKCQIALRLRFIEGYSVPEIAAEFNVSKKYAAKIVKRCLKMAKRRYMKKGAADGRP